MATGIEPAGLTDLRRQVVELARDFARAQVEPHAAEWDRTKHFARDVIDQLGKLGFLGMVTPEEYDGMGLDTVTYLLALEELNEVEGRGVSRVVGAGLKGQTQDGDPPPLDVTEQPDLGEAIGRHRHRRPRCQLVGLALVAAGLAVDPLDQRRPAAAAAVD